MSYKVHDLQTRKTIAVYDLPSCDFAGIFDALAKFHADNELEDCLVGIRDYGEDELREDYSTLHIEKATKNLADVKKDNPGKSKEAKKKIRGAEKKLSNAKKKAKTVETGSGSCYVTAFDWRVHELDNAKEIEYLFYEDGWPGSIIVAKTGRVTSPTQLVLTYIARDKELDASLENILEAADIGKDKRAVAYEVACKLKAEAKASKDKA